MTRPTLVVFDLDDTLYPYEAANRAGLQAISRFASEELGIRSPAFDDALAAARVAVKRRLGSVASSHSRLLYFHETLELIGLRSEPQIALSLEQEYWRNYLLSIELRPGVTELLSTLRYNGVTTAIVTDLTAQIQFRKIAYLQLGDYIDHVVCSEETSQEKISGEPFDLLFERVAEPVLDEVWFVGDQIIDAPVDRFVESGRIKGGRGFVRGAKAEKSTGPWTHFAEIESAVEREFRGDL